jgi:hypothetical protein
MECHFPLPGYERHLVLENSGDIRLKSFKTVQSGDFRLLDSYADMPIPQAAGMVESQEEKQAAPSRECAACLGCAADNEAEPTL